MADWRYLKRSGHLSAHPVLRVEGDLQSLDEVKAPVLKNWAMESDDEILRDVVKRLARRVKDEVENVKTGRIVLRPGLEVQADDWDTFWSAPPIDERNAAWRLNSLLMLDGLTVWALQEEDKDVFDLAVDIVRAWARTNYSSKPSSDMAWHDHATAMRQLRLLRLFEVGRRLGLMTAARMRLFVKLLAAHANSLCDDKFFSGYNNHGLDQSIALYFTGRILNMCAQSGAWLEVSRERMLKLLHQQFTDTDCVHVENSPEYHASVLLRFVQVRHMFGYYDDDKGADQLESVIEAALDYLVHILRPDGMIPIVGDSEAKTLGYKAFRDLKGSPGYDQLMWLLTNGEQGTAPEFGHRVYEEAGYAIFSGDVSGDGDYRRASHLIFKCGLLSSYHRHDDDNNIVLFANGRDWLVDAGLYLHNSADPNRIYVRSAMAHNISVPAKAETIRVPSEGGEVWGVSETAAAKGQVFAATGTSRMFRDHDYIRDLQVCSATQFRIRDRVTSRVGDLNSVTSCFQLPQDLDLAVEPSGIVATAPNGAGRLIIRAVASPPVQILVATGYEGKPPAGWTSPVYNQLDACHQVRFLFDGCEGDSVELEFEVDLELAGDA